MRAAFAIALLMIGTPALAAGTLPYGSRAGMEVTVISMSGIDGPNALIVTKHTRENATAFCREYVGKVTPKCIRDELNTRISDRISANCPRGEFTNFFGKRYRFLGPNKGAAEFAPKYRLVDVATGEEADGSSASGYPIHMELYRALCPSSAPMQD